MKIRLAIIFFSLLLSAPLAVRAGSDISVTPSVIDQKGQARDIWEGKIKIKNDLPTTKVDIYAQVNDVSPEGGLIEYADPSELEMGTSLAKWIDFKRSVIELEPGQETEEQLRIKVPPDAKPGKYHAIIVMARGGNIDIARQSAETLNEARVMVNFEVGEHIVEKAEISEFKPVRAISRQSPVMFSLKIKNIGNREIRPQGEIIVYDNGGKELGSASLSQDKSSIASGTSRTFILPVKVAGGLGKYKAKADLNYGQQTNLNLQDVVYFLYLPTKILIVIVFLVIILVGLAAFWLNRKNKGGPPALPKKPRPAERKLNDYVINLKR